MDNNPGRARQSEIFIKGLGGVKPRVPTNPARLEEMARKAMAAESWAYISGGAGREATVDANRRALDRWQIVPRVLRDVSERSLSITLFGRTLPTPVFLAPVGVLEMAHPDADLAVARATAGEGVPFIFSSQASVAMETCAAAMGPAPRWFQLYWSRSDDLVKSFVTRAERCGCEAIVITVDTPLLGWRTRDLDGAYLAFFRGQGIAQYTSDPVFQAMLSQPLDTLPTAKPPMNLRTISAAAKMIRKYPGGLRANLRSGAPRAAVQRFLATFSRPSLTWEHLDRLRTFTRLPILIKGIQHADDAREAVARGVDGIIVSNHGGRQVDGAIGSLDALVPVVDAVAKRVPVLFDSGIRGGADIFKALALGATAVCIGRPYAYGLAIAGEDGVREVIRNMIAELDLTLALSGYSSVSAVTRNALARET